MHRTIAIGTAAGLLVALAGRPAQAKTTVMTGTNHSDPTDSRAVAKGRGDAARLGASSTCRRAAVAAA